MPVVEFPTYPDRVTDEEIPIGMEAHGTIEEFRTYQTTTIPVGEDPANRRRVQLQYPYHKPVQPDSDAQIACRDAFTAAVAAWHLLDPEDQEEYNEVQRVEYLQRNDHPGTYKARSGFNIFLSDYMTSL